MIVMVRGGGEEWAQRRHMGQCVWLSYDIDVASGCDISLYKVNSHVHTSSWDWSHVAHHFFCLHQVVLTLALYASSLDFELQVIIGALLVEVQHTGADPMLARQFYQLLIIVLRIELLFDLLQSHYILIANFVEFSPFVVVVVVLDATRLVVMGNGNIFLACI